MLIFFLAFLLKIAQCIVTKKDVEINLVSPMYFSSNLYIQVKINSYVPLIPPAAKLILKVPSQLKTQPEDFKCVFIQEGSGYDSICERRGDFEYVGSANGYASSNLILFLSYFYFKDTVLDPIVLTIVNSDGIILDKYEQKLDIIEVRPIGSKFLNL